MRHQEGGNQCHTAELIQRKREDTIKQINNVPDEHKGDIIKQIVAVISKTITKLTDDTNKKLAEINRMI